MSSIPVITPLSVFGSIMPKRDKCRADVLQVSIYSQLQQLAGLELFILHSSPDDGAVNITFSP